MSEDKKKDSGDSKKDIKSKLGDLTKDEPKKEEPKKKEAPKKEAPKKEEAKKEAPKKEEPKMEEPKKEEPKKEPPKKEPPKKAPVAAKASEELQAAAKINAIMEKRCSRLEKTFKVNILVGLVVVCFVIIYMNWVYSNFSDMMKPGVLADVVTHEVTSRIPTFGRDLEGKLKKEAPQIVAAIKNTVINESIPALRRIIQDELNKFLDEFFRTAPDVFNQEVYMVLLTANKAQIEGATANDLSDPKAAAAFEKKLRKNLAVALDKNPTETLSKKLDKTVAALDNINKGLKKLSRGGRLTKGEGLMKQLISSWWTMFEGTDKLSKKDVKGAKEVGKKVADELFGDTKKDPKAAAPEGNTPPPPAPAPPPPAPPAK